MKKLFTLVAVVMFSVSAFAQAPKLTKNRIIYMTTDTVSQIFDGVELFKYPWSTEELGKKLEAIHPINDVEPTDFNYKFAFRKDYTDAETGFTLKKGFYRGVFVINKTLALYNPNTEINKFGYTNLKKVVMYFVGLPQTWISDPVRLSFSDCPAGRVQARYANAADGTALSNQAYRECHVSSNKKSVADGGTAFIQPTTGEFVYDIPDFLNYKIHASADGTKIDPRLVTFDQPYKMVVDLSNPKDGKDYESIFASEEKKSEFANYMCDGQTAGEMSYFFAKTGTCSYATDKPDAGDSATGYNCYDNKWGDKIDWSADYAMQVGIKKRMVLVGVAFICGTDNAETEFINPADYNQETVTIQEGAGEAFGNNETFDKEAFAMNVNDPWNGAPYFREDFTGPTGIKDIVAGKNVNDTRMFNAQGIEVNDNYRGLVICKGKAFVK